MKMQRPILVIDIDLDSARESANLVYELCRYPYILPELVSQETTVSRCWNMAPICVFIRRDIQIKQSGLSWQIKDACHSVGAAVYAFSSLDELKKLVQTEKFITKFLRKEEKNGSTAYNNVLSGLPFGG